MPGVGQCTHPLSALPLARKIHLYPVPSLTHPTTTLLLLLVPCRDKPFSPCYYCEHSCTILRTLASRI